MNSAFFAGPLERVYFIIIALSCSGIYANKLSAMSLYLNFTDTNIVEEDFTKTIGFELKICHRLKAID
jgi:hypothetical protein